MIVNNGMERAEKILNDNIDLLHKLSKELLEREILDAEEIDTIIKGEELPPIPDNGQKAEKSDEQNSAEVPEHVQKMINQRDNKDTAAQE